MSVIYIMVVASICLVAIIVNCLVLAYLGHPITGSIITIFLLLLLVAGIMICIILYRGNQLSDNNPYYDLIDYPYNNSVNGSDPMTLPPKKKYDTPRKTAIMVIITFAILVISFAIAICTSECRKFMIVRKPNIRIEMPPVRVILNQVTLQV
jgi:amino acid transporter